MQNSGENLQFGANRNPKDKSWLSEKVSNWICQKVKLSLSCLASWWHVIEHVRKVLVRTVYTSFSDFTSLNFSLTCKLGEQIPFMAQLLKSGIRRKVWMLGGPRLASMYQAMIKVGSIFCLKNSALSEGLRAVFLHFLYINLHLESDHLTMK